MVYKYDFLIIGSGVAGQSVYAVGHRAVAGCDEVIEGIGCRCAVDSLVAKLGVAIV